MRDNCFGLLDSFAVTDESGLIKHDDNGADAVPT